MMMMAEAQEEDDRIFVYMGGDQQVPRHIRRARIHKSVKIVRARAFRYRRNLISVEFHDGVEIIEEDAFNDCKSLKSFKLLGIKILKEGAFCFCSGLTDVEFGDKLETIEESAFHFCTSLRNIRMPSVMTIGVRAFYYCIQLTDLEFPEGLETLHENAFQHCESVRRITMPLKDDMIAVSVFNNCPNLTTVDLVGGIHKTIASLHLDSWINEMKGEISEINQTLPNTDRFEKTQAVQQWMGSVIRRLDRYKAEHQKVLKEATTLLELALWKANLEDNEGGVVETEGVRFTRGRRKRARREISITSGASIVIKNVLPFLELK